jgi:hypothetical protein
MYCCIVIDKVTVYQDGSDSSVAQALVSLTLSLSLSLSLSLFGASVCVSVFQCVSECLCAFVHILYAYAALARNSSATACAAAYVTLQRMLISYHICEDI